LSIAQNPPPQPIAPQPPAGTGASQTGSDEEAEPFDRADAGTLNCFVSSEAPHDGHRGVSLADRTRASKSRSHVSQ
jgi:hypothetical protein